MSKTYWLIERGSPAEWWAGSDHPGCWTRDVSQVHPLLKFPSKEKAQGEAERIKYWPAVFPSELRVAEHMDCAGPTHEEIDAMTDTRSTTPPRDERLMKMIGLLNVIAESDNHQSRCKNADMLARDIAALFVPSESAPILDTYKAKVERDAATIAAMRLKLLELCDRLAWKGPSREENLNITAREARELVKAHDRIAAGVAFVTDTKLGGE